VLQLTDSLLTDRLTKRSRTWALATLRMDADADYLLCIIISYMFSLFV